MVGAETGSESPSGGATASDGGDSDPGGAEQVTPLWNTTVITQEVRAKLVIPEFARLFKGKDHV